MSELPLNVPWALALLVGLGWTTVFSLLQPPLRGLRNLGILASYVLGLVMAIQAPWRDALFTWAVFALVGGLTYVMYEAWSRSRSPAEGDRLSLAPLLHAALAWPIMLPEAVEYLLAEMGVLKPPPSAGEDSTSSAVAIPTE